MKTVLCDASPLIFLARVDLLHLIPAVLPGEICVLRCVADEVRVEGVDPVEAKRVDRFLENVRVIDYDNPNHPSQALSRCDRSTLNWAMENRPDWLVADERLLRRIAREAGIAVIGILGIIIQAARQDHLTPESTRSVIDDLVAKHDFRITVSLYRRVVAEIASL